MTTRPQTSIEGALYDLVARGKKDTFFQRDESTSVNLFDARYESTPEYIAELRQIVPRNRVQWGNVVEFDIEKAGDILIEPTLLIRLPSWYPINVAKLNANNILWDANTQTRYGYVNCIGYFLFEKIQFYQDNILLQEYSGDSLFALRHLRGSYNSAFLEDSLTGVHDGSPLSIQRAATPGELRLRIPLPFCQHSDEGGLPLCATESQQFRLRLTLRKLEDLVECSANISTKPVPWDREFAITDVNNNVTTFQSISRYMMAEPTIYLENRQLYINKDDSATIAIEEHITTFSRLYENRFTFAVGDSSGITKRLLEGRHPAEQIYWFFRSREDLVANRLWKFNRGGLGSYYNSMKLTIAGRDREDYWPSLIWEDIEAHAKQELYSGRAISSMNWSYGEKHSYRGGREISPTGTLNFTSADRPTIYIDFTGSTNSDIVMNLIVDGYGTYYVKDSRGGLLFAN